MSNAFPSDKTELMNNKTRKPNFVVFYNDIFGLPISAEMKMTYLFLFKHVNSRRDDSKVWPGLKMIYEFVFLDYKNHTGCRISVAYKRIEEVIDQLEEIGLVSKEINPDHKTNNDKYIFNVHDYADCCLETRCVGNEYIRDYKRIKAGKDVSRNEYMFLINPFKDNERTQSYNRTIDERINDLSIQTSRNVTKNDVKKSVPQNKSGGEQDPTATQNLTFNVTNTDAQRHESSCTTSQTELQNIEENESNALGFNGFFAQMNSPNHINSNQIKPTRLTETISSPTPTALNGESDFEFSDSQLNEVLPTGGEPPDGASFIENTFLIAAGKESLTESGSRYRGNPVGKWAHRFEVPGMTHYLYDNPYLPYLIKHGFAQPRLLDPTGTVTPVTECLEMGKVPTRGLPPEVLRKSEEQRRARGFEGVYEYWLKYGIVNLAFNCQQKEEMRRDNHYREYPDMMFVDLINNMFGEEFDFESSWYHLSPPQLGWLDRFYPHAFAEYKYRMFLLHPQSLERINAETDIVAGDMSPNWREGGHKNWFVYQHYYRFLKQYKDKAFNPDMDKDPKHVAFLDDIRPMIKNGNKYRIKQGTEPNRFNFTEQEIEEGAKFWEENVLSMNKLPEFQSKRDVVCRSILDAEYSQDYFENDEVVLADVVPKDETEDLKPSNIVSVPVPANSDLEIPVAKEGKRHESKTKKKKSNSTEEERDWAWTVWRCCMAKMAELGGLKEMPVSANPIKDQALCLRALKASPGKNMLEKFERVYGMIEQFGYIVQAKQKQNRFKAEWDLPIPSVIFTDKNIDLYMNTSAPVRAPFDEQKRIYDYFTDLIMCSVNVDKK